MATEQIFQEAEEALRKIQTFEADTLGREGDLGKQLNFVEAIEPAKQLIALYRRIPLSALEDLTDSQLRTITGQANADLNVFNDILTFDATRSDAASHRSTTINTLRSRRDQLFEQVWQLVAYGVARITDTSLLEVQARATIQAIENKAEKLTESLINSKLEADNALSAIRQVASEQGVSQQAVHFKSEAEAQEALAGKWLGRTQWAAVAVGFFAVVTLFLHKWAWFKPADHGELIQLITSKVLIFGVLAYLLILSAKNYMTHKHNAVVNKHRQNALLTYRALVESASSTGVHDIVLANAASCIFAPQETGFSQGKGDSSTSPKSVLELMTKGVAKSEA